MLLEMAARDERSLWLERGPWNIGQKRSYFNGTVQENAARLAVAAGGKLLTHDLGSVIVQHGPDRGPLRQGPFPDEVGHDIFRQSIFRHELAKFSLSELGDVGFHEPVCNIVRPPAATVHLSVNWASSPRPITLSYVRPVSSSVTESRRKAPESRDAR